MKGIAKEVSHDSEPGTEFRVITPGNSTDLGIRTDANAPLRYPRAIWVGVGGNVAITGMHDTDAVTLVGVPSGCILPVRPKFVMLTNTTATTMVAIY